MSQSIIPLSNGNYLNTSVLNIADVSGTTFSVGAAQALTPGHSFTWYVLAMSTNDLAYNYLSSGETFTLAGLPVPVPARPSSTVPAATGFDMPTFSWSSVAGASAYAVYVVDNNASPVAGTGTISSTGTTVTGTGTLFLSGVVVGDQVGIRVTAIVSNSSLTLASASRPRRLQDRPST